LRGELRARGVNAALTRDADVFIPLAERTRIANRAGADVFISIHLNASANLATTGIETYYLDNTTDRATIRLAQIENASGASPGYGAPEEVNLNYILSDLRQQYKASESAALARIIDAQTAAELGAALGLAVNALGAKKGPFWVLVGAHMPAVLVECGFLSNAAEAERLASPAYQSAIARGIASAVIHYLNEDAAVGSL
jgi:N-acetylmuramoyl-L-alanine amidase